MDSSYSPGQEIMSLAALQNCERVALNHRAENVSACGLIRRPQSFAFGMKLKYVCPFVFIFLFSNPLIAIFLPLSWVMFVSYHCCDASLQAQLIQDFWQIGRYYVLLTGHV